MGEYEFLDYFPKSGGQAVLGRQSAYATPWLTERHGYDPTSAEANFQDQFEVVAKALWLEIDHALKVKRKARHGGI